MSDKLQFVDDVYFLKLNDKLKFIGHVQGVGVVVDDSVAAVLLPGRVDDDRRSRRDRELTDVPSNPLGLAGSVTDANGNVAEGPGFNVFATAVTKSRSPSSPR